MVAAGIKIGFGLILVALYAFVAATMIDGATSTPGYDPNDATDWIITVTGGGLLAFVAAQIGVVIATPGGGVRDRMRTSLFGTTTTGGSEDRVAVATLVVLLVDVVVLMIAGALFVRLYVQPENIAVGPGADRLTDAPAYIALQAKSIIGLVIAGAGGIGVAAAR